jgi:hypothetical protein
MRATFEEKSYENYFNTELAGRSKIFFPLGQVQEGNLGFDASAFSRNSGLWRMLGHSYLFSPRLGGLELREVANEMERYLGIIIRDIPQMKANLLFQYKKPEFITVSLGTEWVHWNEPYFRYNIYKEQQNLLAHIHNSLGTRVLIVYAAPAIQDVNELVKVFSKRQLIENSNFTKAADLTLHRRNTYIQAGTYSIACSEPEKIENFDILKELETFSGESKSSYSNDNFNKQFIIGFREQMESILKNDRYFSNSFNTLNESLAKYTKHELLYSFLVMANFRLLTGTQWLIKI